MVQNFVHSVQHHFHYLKGALPDSFDFGRRGLVINTANPKPNPRLEPLGRLLFKEFCLLFLMQCSQLRQDKHAFVNQLVEKTISILSPSKLIYQWRRITETNRFASKRQSM